MCEDFPCCGHEHGCCPDFDENGKQLNMKCTCGATVNINSRFSICKNCLANPIDEYGDEDYDYDYDDCDDGCDDREEDYDEHPDDYYDYED